MQVPAGRRGVGDMPVGGASGKGLLFLACGSRDRFLGGFASITLPRALSFANGKGILKASQGAPFSHAQASLASGLLELRSTPTLVAHPTYVAAMEKL